MVSRLFLGKIFLALTIASMTFNCSHQALILDNPGSFILSSGGEQIHISDQTELLIEWQTETGDFVTSALREQEVSKRVFTKIPTKITVNIIEANDSYIRVKSHAWDSRQDLPRHYFEENSEFEVINQDPVSILIPWRQISNIYIYDRQYTWDDFFDSPRLMLLGAAGGALAFLASTGEAAQAEVVNVGQTGTDGKTFFISALTGSALGAVIYPIIVYFEVTYGTDEGEDIKKYSHKYRVNDLASGCEIIIGESGK